MALTAGWVQASVVVAAAVALGLPQLRSTMALMEEVEGREEAVEPETVNLAVLLAAPRGAAVGAAGPV